MDAFLPFATRCVVTGAAGFIGSHVVDHLLAAGHDVVGIDSFDPWYSPMIKWGHLADALRSTSFELVGADLVDADLTAIFQPGDVVFHLAARAGVQDSWGEGFETTMRSNVLGTQRVFEAALARGCARVVAASSSSIYGETAAPAGARIVAPVSPYGVSKAACEQLADVYGERGLDVVCMRYFTVFGARQRPDMAFHRLFRSASPGLDDVFPLRGTGEQRREFTHVSDIAEATVLAGFVPGVGGRRYDLGGGTSASLNEAMAAIEGIVDAPIRLARVGVAAGDPDTTVADLTAARLDLGWKPKLPLLDGLVDQWQWHLTSGVPQGCPVG